MQLTKLQKALATVFVFCAAAIAAYYHIYRPIPSRINIDAIEDIHGSAFDEAVALLDIEDVTARSVEIERLQSYFDSKPVVVSVSLRDPKLFRKRVHGELVVTLESVYEIDHGNAVSNRSR